MKDDVRFAILENKKVETPEDNYQPLDLNTVTYAMLKKQEETKILDKIYHTIDSLKFKNLTPLIIILSSDTYKTLAATQYHYLSSVRNTLFGIPVVVDGSENAPKYKVLCKPMEEILFRYKSK